MFPVLTLPGVGRLSESVDLFWLRVVELVPQFFGVAVVDVVAALVVGIAALIAPVLAERVYRAA